MTPFRVFQNPQRIDGFHEIYNFIKFLKEIFNPLKTYIFQKPLFFNLLKIP
jgi:hypothetical protein